VSVTVGVLGLQGDFALHLRSLKNLGVDSGIVRTPAELSACNGLILPGGESTTFVNLLRKTGMFDAVKSFADRHAVMGTCAGLITLSRTVVGDGMETLGLIDLSVERNAYGRQVDSFVDRVSLELPQKKFEFEGVFIRAPKIRAMGKGVTALGHLGKEVVMAGNDHVLVMTFHPELTDDTRIHAYFAEEMAGRKK
jgi:pyridoxal 5'-phosphate synthase pdxT subunit